MIEKVCIAPLGPKVQRNSQMEDGVKIDIFGAIFRFISETIQDTATIQYGYKMQWKRIGSRMRSIEWYHFQ